MESRRVGGSEGLQVSGCSGERCSPVLCAWAKSFANLDESHIKVSFKQMLKLDPATKDRKSKVIVA